MLSNIIYRAANIDILRVALNILNTADMLSLLMMLRFATLPVPAGRATFQMPRLLYFSVREYTFSRQIAASLDIYFSPYFFHLL